MFTTLGMHRKVGVKEIPDCFVLSKRMKVMDENSMHKLFAKEKEKLIESVIRFRIPEYQFIICYDQEYLEEDKDVEFCFSVKDEPQSISDFVFKCFPAAASVACIKHYGAYIDLNASYRALAMWILENGYEIVDEAREVYIWGEWNCTRENEWLTEIQIPVRNA